MPRVLVCEGERHITRLIQVNLERQGYEVLARSDGNSCLQLLRQTPVDLLVIGEPEAMTSNEVLSAIQDDPSIEVKVLVLRKRPDFPEPPTGPFGGSPPMVISSPVLIPDLRSLLTEAAI